MGPLHGGSSGLERRGHGGSSGQERRGSRWVLWARGEGSMHAVPTKLHVIQAKKDLFISERSLVGMAASLIGIAHAHKYSLRRS